MYISNHGGAGGKGERKKNSGDVFVKRGTTERLKGGTAGGPKRHLRIEKEGSGGEEKTRLDSSSITREKPEQDRHQVMEKTIANEANRGEVREMDKVDYEEK